MGSLRALRSAGRFAYLQRDREVTVLDLAFDSVVDTPDGVTDAVRRLRFTGPGCTVELEVRGRRQLVVHLTVSPTGPVVVESRTPHAAGPRTILGPAGAAVIPLRSQLTSFVLHWPESGRRPARTAWVLL